MGVPFRDWSVTFNDGGTPLCEPGGMCMVFIPNGPLATVFSPRDPFGNVTPNPGIGIVLFPTLSVTSSGGRLVMTGTFTVNAVGGGQVEKVVTQLWTSIGMTPRVFTVATLSKPVPVSQGQIVQFTYTLSFS